MIESGAGTPDLSQIVAFATLAVMTSTAYSLDRAFSPKVKTSPPVTPKEQAELLREFMKLNPELQRGVLKYASEMRGGYKKKTKT